MKLKLLALLIVFINFSKLSSQTQELKLTGKDSTIVSSWIFGLGFNIVDDSGDMFNEVLDIKDSWNMVPYPSRISIGKYFKNGLGVEVIASYNRYKKGKEVDGMVINESFDYYAFDSRLSYDLNKIIGETGWFDPYVGVGIGYSNINSVSRGTYNGVLGFRAWFSDKLGLDANTTGKWTMKSGLTNQIQHAIGVVYRFNYKKELTEEGKEKLAEIEALQKEKDSIAAADLAKEKELELQQKIAEEKEKARLAQLEKEKQEASERKLNEIQDKIKGIGDIHFGFDSSALNSSSKSILSKLTDVFNDYPDLTLEIGSHTDSRGSREYNQLLSERRLKSTLDYLFKQGISSDKISGKAYGEDKLLNECDDNTKCSEDKHKQNRRSEINIVNF